jgi:uncharacterized protein YjbJ (UPF0337 family)
MKTSLPWIIAGASVAAAIYFVFNPPSPRYATGYESVEDAAGRTAGWGTKQRLSGTGTNVIGKVKEGIGRITGDPDLADEGVGDQAVGAIKDGAGQLASAAAQTLHDLNH